VRWGRVLRRRHRRLAHEAGFTLPELLTVLAILGTVITAITAVFVTGTHAEADMNDRFQAQQQTRLALMKVRRDIRCARSATVTGYSLTLTLPSLCKSGQGATTWSVVQLGPSRYGLFRCAADVCGASGRKWGDHLVYDSASPSNVPPFVLLPATQTTRPRVQVTLPVDLRPNRVGGVYTLVDAIALWNGSKA
jgi:prepilin-type N-terminal cleavage/methylation domain-containing protein